MLSTYSWSSGGGLLGSYRLLLFMALIIAACSRAPGPVLPNSTVQAWNSSMSYHKYDLRPAGIGCGDAACPPPPPELLQVYMRRPRDEQPLPGPQPLPISTPGLAAVSQVDSGQLFNEQQVAEALARLLATMLRQHRQSMAQHANDTHAALLPRPLHAQVGGYSHWLSLFHCMPCPLVRASIPCTCR